jgi:hypothetical protein
VVGTECHHGLEEGHELPGETVHTRTVKKLGGMANLLSNVCIRDDAESSHVLKDVQSGKDIDCEVVEQRIRLGMAVHDRIPVSDAVRFGIVLEHSIVVVEYAAWKESQAAQLAGGWCCGVVVLWRGGRGRGEERGAGTDRESRQRTSGTAGSCCSGK